jgi:GntR family transcriptional regulator
MKAAVPVEADSISVPLYLQIRNTLLEEIAAGRHADGDEVLTEKALQERFGVSRATVRHALDTLEREGIIARRKGFGTIVQAPKIRPELVHLTSFTEDVQRRGLQPGSKTLDIALVAPPLRVSEAFHLRETDKVWYVLRLRTIDGAPVGLHDLYIPPNIEFSPQTLASMSSYYELLRTHHHLEPEHAVETLTACNAGEREARLLGVAEGTALLIVERLTHAQSGQPIEYVRIAYRAEQYEYQVKLFRNKNEHHGRE